MSTTGGDYNDSYTASFIIKQNKMTISLTYIGVLVTVIGAIFSFAGVPVVESKDIETAISVIAQFVGAIVALYGRYRVGGLSVFGVRK